MAEVRSPAGLAALLRAVALNTAGLPSLTTLADAALWLARVVADELPREAEAQGLLALLLFHRAREGARAVDGELVLLADQDRARWDRRLIAEAQAVLDKAAMLRRPGRWQLHAAIAACHSDTRDAIAKPGGPISVKAVASAR